MSEKVANSGKIDPPAAQKRIIFFDGDCGLCQRFVRLVLASDEKRIFWLAPLQGETFAKLKYNDDAIGLDLQTMVLFEGEHFYKKSRAALRVLRRLGGIWGALGSLGLLVPQRIADVGYGLIAKNRHRLFRKTTACPVPSQGELERFLP
jgi:predicted DCC family thiol-disulfide oxidoreductase YuxK